MTAGVAVIGHGAHADVLAAHAELVGAPVQRLTLGDLADVSLRGLATVLVAADHYPDHATRLSEDAVRALRAFLDGGGRVYTEFAEDGGAGLLLPVDGEPVRADFERLVVLRDGAVPTGLPIGRVLESHQARMLPVSCGPHDTELLGYARVAGTIDTASGLPAHTRPGLVHRAYGAGHLVQASTALSHHRAGRYKPRHDWDDLLAGIVRFLLAGGPAQRAVRPAYRTPDAPGARDAPGGPAAWRSMLDRAVRWFDRSGVLLGTGDGRGGVAEGFESQIDDDGNQPLRTQVRGDCFIQTADALHRYAQLTGLERPRQVAGHLANLVTGRMQVCKDDVRRGRWETRGYTGSEPSSIWIFPDDDGMITFHTLLLARRHRSARMLEVGLRAAEALYRSASVTTGAQPTMNLRTLSARGWDHYTRQPVPTGFATSPHYQAAPQAALLVAHALTGEPRYLEVALRGLDHILAALPNIGIVTSRTEEYARLLLPLSAALSATGDPRYREALAYLTDFLADRQDPTTGAIAEWDGHHPERDADYGTRENSVFSGNGDPITDQLYTTGFLATNLWVAHRACGDDRLGQIHERLLDYLARIQVDADDPRFDGCWMRSFDYERWEYHGSNADIGWGPYAVETGWSVAPIMTGALLRLLDDPMLPTQPWDPDLGRDTARRVRAELDAVARRAPAVSPLPQPALHLSFDDPHDLGADSAGGPGAEVIGRYVGWVPRGVLDGALQLAQHGTHPCHLRVAEAPDLGAGPFTLALWVYPEHSTVDAEKVGLATAGDPGFWLEQGRPVAVLPGRAGSIRMVGEVILPASSWSHLALVHDGIQARLWVNGHVRAQATSPQRYGTVKGIPAPRPPLLVGAGGTGASLHPFRGMVDDLRFTPAVVDPDLVELDLWRSPC